MHPALTVDMCVGIRDGCPMSYHISADQQAELSFGGSRDGCHYAFDAGALKQLLKLGAEALAEIEAGLRVKTATAELVDDELGDEEPADQDRPTLVTAGKRPTERPA